MYITKFFSVFASVALLAACSNYQSGGPNNVKKQDIGMVAGALGGAFAGKNLGKGNGQVLGIAAGALLGSFLGKEIGASLDRADVNYHQQAYGDALERQSIGKTSTWNNPDSGNSGSITPTRTYKTQTGVYCREFTQKIYIDGKEQTGYGSACRQPDGTWQIQS